MCFVHSPSPEVVLCSPGSSTGLLTDFAIVFLVVCVAQPRQVQSHATQITKQTRRRHEKSPPCLCAFLSTPILAVWLCCGACEAVICMYGLIESMWVFLMTAEKSCLPKANLKLDLV
ncbi:TPA: hypothetical protein ACH3X2_003555 [Trebouxia sp. C0005]